MYNGVGGSVVPATPSASGIRVFTIKLRVVAPPEWKYSVWTGTRRALPQGVVRQCRAVNWHNMFLEVSGWCRRRWPFHDEAQGGGST